MKKITQIVPSVSIIIPTYNGEAYLESIINTVEPYYKQNYEVILVDDGSKKEDKTIEKFQSIFPDAICIRQENSGVAEARNTGVKAASREFVQLLDIDDSISPDKLESQYKAAVENYADIVYSDWCMRTVYEDGNLNQEPTVKSEIASHYSDHIEALLDRWWNPPHSYLIRKTSYLQIGGGDKTLVNAQDFDVFVRLAIHGFKFYYQPGLFSFYYRYLNTNSLARGPRERYWKDTESVIEKSISLLTIQQNLKMNYRKAAAQRLFLVSRNTFKIDEDWSNRIYERIINLDSSFFPKYESFKYKAIYKLLGFKKAEQFLRRLK